MLVLYMLHMVFYIEKKGAKVYVIPIVIHAIVFYMCCVTVEICILYCLLFYTYRQQSQF